MLKVTLDTNVLPAKDLVEKAKVKGIKIDFKVVTVTGRELENTDITIELSTIGESGVYGEARYGEAVYSPRDSVLYEPFVLNESRINSGVIVQAVYADTFELTLAMISNNTFPARSSRSSLTFGQRRQLRDAIIWMAHIREKRDVFVTNDVKGFVGPGGYKRLNFERLFQSRIMTRGEFTAEFLS